MAKKPRKLKPKPKYKPKKGKRSQMDILKFNVYVFPLILLLFLGIFMLVQFFGERLRISPVIILGVWPWMTLAEAVLLFVFFLGLSLFLTLNLAFYLMKKSGRI